MRPRLRWSRRLPSYPGLTPVLHSINGASSKNKFVHLALQRSLTLAAELKSVGTLQNTLSYGLDITIVGDNDFYSQRAQVRTACCACHI